MGISLLIFRDKWHILATKLSKQTGQRFWLVSSYMEQSIEQSKTHGAPRSDRWPEVRSEFLKGNKSCAACGSSKDVQVHHVVAFHTHPELELDPSNFMPLCEGMERNCHRFVGHLDDFRSINERSREDAAEWSERIASRPEWDKSKGEWSYPHAE